MREDYKSWLVEQDYSDQSVRSWIGYAKSVEKAYGNLEELLASGGFPALLEELTYSSDDARRNRPNPSRFQIKGALRSSLATYKRGSALYERFLGERGSATQNPGTVGQNATAAVSQTEDGGSAEKQRLSLEHDMQSALRRDISQLEPGLVVIDDGAERYVASGFIDILCRDGAGQVVVVELKAGKTDAKVIGQTLGYMGDLMEEDALQSVRGIIVAHAFDQRTLSAARAVTGLKLYTYAVTFQFQPVKQA